jgi:CBS domain containing-hemolysin-like protein
VLLPSFDLAARLLSPLTLAVAGLIAPRRDRQVASVGDGDAAEERATPAEQAEEAAGLIEGDQRRLLQSIVEFGDTLVREVMTPRPDIVAIAAGATLDELRQLLREQGYSRVPVFKENLDNILGFVFVKDLIQVIGDAAGSSPISAFMRPAHFVPETKRVSDLLKEFQQQQVQIAIVVDEYGGTAGLVTIEDLLEELVGEIRDEYDKETEPVTDEGDGTFVFTGKADIDHITEQLGLTIEREGFDTVGGYLLSRLGRVPAVGETLEVDGLLVEVLDAERRRVNKVRMRRRPAIDQPEGGE